MAKTLDEIEEFVESKNEEFLIYLQKVVPTSIFKIIMQISETNNVYVFSGIIRDYFLGRAEIRDIDIVIEKPINIGKYFENCKIEKNNFGGYKIYCCEIIIDLWYAKDSWAYKVQSVFDFDIGKYIFKTAYFNFSAILYFINEKKFYYSKHFLRFLQNKEIDIVFLANKSYDLCIINTIYYSKKYNLKISKALAKEIVNDYLLKKHEFDSVQMKHFGKIKYNLHEIDTFIQNIKKDYKDLI